MRNLIFSINLTADGCCDHTKGVGYDDIHVFYADLIRQAGLLVYGRKTYELMVPYWPDMARDHSGPTDAQNDFAQAFDSVPKLVFSKTLDKVDDKNSTLVNTDLRDEIIKLKLQDGKDILVGGVDLPCQLIELGLVDEFQFMIQPLIAGDGRRLMEGITLPASLQLTLVETRPFDSGCYLLRYKIAPQG